MRDRFRAAPAAVRARVVVRLLMAIGGGDYPPRFERLAALAEAMTAPAGGRFKRTLAGCVVERRDGGFVFYREIGRAGRRRRRAASPVRRSSGTAASR